jgi:hypothetical protein
VSTHRTALIDASCAAIWVACPVATSYIRPRCRRRRRISWSHPGRDVVRVRESEAEYALMMRTWLQQTLSTGAWCWYIAFPWLLPPCPISYTRTRESRPACVSCERECGGSTRRTHAIIPAADGEEIRVI